MVILDEIYFPSEEPLIDIISGSGAYSTIIRPCCIAKPRELRELIDKALQAHLVLDYSTLGQWPPLLAG